MSALHPVVERLRDDFQAHFQELECHVGRAVVLAAIQGSPEAQEDVLALAKHLGRLQHETQALLTVLQRHMPEPAPVIHDHGAVQEQKDDRTDIADIPAMAADKLQKYGLGVFGRYRFAVESTENGGKT